MSAEPQATTPAAELQRQAIAARGWQKLQERQVEQPVTIDTDEGPAILNRPQIEIAPDGVSSRTELITDLDGEPMVQGSPELVGGWFVRHAVIHGYPPPMQQAPANPKPVFKTAEWVKALNNWSTATNDAAATYMVEHPDVPWDTALHAVQGTVGHRPEMNDYLAPLGQPKEENPRPFYNSAKFRRAHRVWIMARNRAAKQYMEQHPGAPWDDAVESVVGTVGPKPSQPIFMEMLPFTETRITPTTPQSTWTATHHLASAALAYFDDDMDGAASWLWKAAESDPSMMDRPEFAEIQRCLQSEGIDYEDPGYGAAVTPLSAIGTSATDDTGRSNTRSDSLGTFRRVLVGDNWWRSSVLEKLGRAVCGVLMLVLGICAVPFVLMFKGDAPK